MRLVYIMNLDFVKIVKIGIEEYINAILIIHNIRNAMMIQPQDYKERTFSDKKTKFIISELKNIFPTLKSSNSYQGIILSKTKYLKKDMDTLLKIGKILGYPCADDFEKILDNPDLASIAFELIANTKYGRFQLFACRCLDNKYNTYIKNIAKNANKIKTLKTLVDNFEIKITKNIPINYLIDKLLRNKKINKNENAELLNYIWNIGFEELPQYSFDYNNPIHKGIILTLLCYCLYTPIEPFFPLQKYPNEDKKVYELTSNWEKDIFHILLTSKDNVLNNYSEIFKNNSFIQLSNYNFDNKNLIHKGIILTLISYCKNNLLTPFLKLKDNEVLIIIKKFEEKLINIIIQSMESSKT
jgi:hypothetical protein